MISKSKKFNYFLSNCLTPNDPRFSRPPLVLAAGRLEAAG